MSKTQAALCGLILLLTAAAFSPALRNGFVNRDDDVYVCDNPQVRTLSAENTGKFFSSFYMACYLPVTMQVYALERRLAGPEPFFFHLVSVSLHAANALLVFALLLALTRSGSASFIGASLFAVHPLRVESVAWVSELKDVLYVFFYLLSCLLYLRYLELKRKTAYFAALALFLLSLLSKVSAVSLPAVLLLFDYFKARQFTRESLLEKVPFLQLALAFGLVGLIPYTLQVSGPGLWAGESLARFPAAVLFYLSKTVWPAGFSALYSRPELSCTYAALNVLPGTAALAAAAWLVARKAVSGREALFAAGFFLVTLAPSLGVINALFAADRYAYLPSLGISFFAGLALARYYSRGGVRAYAALIFCGLALGGLVFASRARCAVWESGRTLWTDVLARSPENSEAWNSLGDAYAEVSDHEAAIVSFRRSLELNPANAMARHNLVLSYMAAGRYKEVLAACAGPSPADPGGFCRRKAAAAEKLLRGGVRGRR